MSLYKTTQPDILAIRLSEKRVNEKYRPKWKILHQPATKIAIKASLPLNTVGLYIGETKGHLIGSKILHDFVLLLVGPTLWYVPTQYTKLITEEEIKNAIQP